MEDRQQLSLDDKIQKLINNYTELKNKYANLMLEKAELEKNLNDLSNFKNTNSGKLEELESSNIKQKEEIEFLRTENQKLREQIQQYDSRMKEASSRLDSVFDQLNDL